MWAFDFVQELALQEPTLDFLTPEYQAILGDADKIQAEYKEHPTNLEYLHGANCHDSCRFRCSTFTSVP